MAISEIAKWCLDNPAFVVAVVVPIVGAIAGAIQNYTAQRRGRSATLVERPTLLMTPGQVMAAARNCVMVYTSDGHKADAKKHKRSPDFFWRGELSSIIETDGGKLLGEYSSSGVNCYLAQYDGFAVLAIRGTEGFADMAADLCTWVVPGGKQGYAHAGFHSAAMQIYQHFRKRLMELQSAGNKIIVTGHSYGAASAIEFGSVAATLDLEVDGIVALCAPRSGTAAHANWISEVYRDRLLRVTFSRDVVACMPPAPFFRHAGHTHYFDATREYHPHLTTMFRLVDFAGALLRDFGRILRETLRYHSAATVRDLVVENIEKFPLNTFDDA